MIAALACGFALAFAPTQAFAAMATDFSFSDASTIALDFDEIAMGHGTIITNQYQSGFGVSFTPNMWFETNRTGLGCDANTIANFQTGTSTVNSSVDFVFSTAVTSAAFEIAANNNNTFLFEAVSAGTVVESFSFASGTCCAAQIRGFRDINFDTLRVSHQTGGSAFFIADQLTWNPVPEPTTALLLLLGLALMPRRDREQ